MTLAFTHETRAQRVTIAAGRAAEAVTEELDRVGAEGVMIIGGRRAGALVGALGARARLVWDELAQHVPRELAARATTAAQDAQVDAVVAIGGGSAIGLAKAVVLTHTVPVVAVPTTYAGSEATDVWGLTDADGKRTGADARVLPRAVVYDPDLVRGLPAELVVASGLNAVAHGVDSMWAPHADPITESVALGGLAALRQGLLGLAAHPGDVVSAARTQYGCYLVGVAFASAGSAMHHKICHVLGGTLGLPHAATHAVVLPYVLAWNEPAAPNAAQALAAAFDAATASEGLGRLHADLGAPTALRDLGMREDDVARVVPPVLRSIPPSNPRPVDEESLTRLLHAAWAGDDPRSLDGRTGERA